MNTARQTALQLLFISLLIFGSLAPVRADLSAARAALDNEDYFEALRAALESVADSPVAAYQTRGEAYLGLKEPDLAFGQFQRALSHDPQNPALLISLAEMLEKDGAVDDAILYYDAAYEIEPANDEIATRLMELLDGEREVLQEIELGNRALEYVQDDETKSWIHMRLGHLYYGMRKFEEARSNLETHIAATETPTTTTLYFLAWTYYNFNEDKKVIETIDRALLVDATSAEMIMLKADALFRSKKMTEAYEEYWRIKESGSDFWNEIPQKRRLAIARHKKQIPDIIVERYGLLVPLYIFAGVLAILFVATLVFYMGSKSRD